MLCTQLSKLCKTRARSLTRSVHSLTLASSSLLLLLSLNAFFSWNESVAHVYAWRDLGIIRLNRDEERTHQKMYFNKSHTISDVNGLTYHRRKTSHTSYHHTIVCVSINCTPTLTHYRCAIRLRFRFGPRV